MKSARLLNSAIVGIALGVAAVAISVPGMALGEQEERVRLRDGTTVFIDEHGQMRMEDAHGHPLVMEEGQMMETEDGDLIMMHGKVLWRQHHGKSHPPH